MMRQPRGRYQRPAGEVAGTIDADGYVVVDVDGERYYAHDLAWLLKTGSWPPTPIEHINGVRSDNRWANLRLRRN